MRIRPRIAVGMFLVLLLSACTPAAGVSPTIVPTLEPSPAPLPPSPTPVPVFAAGSEVAGVDVSGMSLATAREQLIATLAQPPQTVEIHVGDVEFPLDATMLGLSPALETLLEEARADLTAGRPADVPRTTQLDVDALRLQLESLAEQVAVPPEITVISSTKVISRSFAYTPGMILDVDAAVARINTALKAPELPATITLSLSEDPTVPQITTERLQREVAAMADDWDGVVGFHLYDLQNGESVRFQDETVFAGASTIKVAILLYSYVQLESFSEKQEFWLGEMIKYSDNISANHLMSAAAGGTGTDIAFTGAEEMSALLSDDLGLENFYLYVPYEATDYIKQNKIEYMCGPKDPVGPKPYTETGCALRANPYAIAQVYKAIDACTQGEGVLLEKFDRLTPDRCQEMLDRLATNADKTRMVAGVPKGTRVEHKSGWIENMQADAGIVRSPGGDYVLAVYIYKKLTGDAYMWPDELMAPAVAAFSRLAYTAYNPIRLEEK